MANELHDVDELGKLFKRVDDGVVASIEFLKVAEERFRPDEIQDLVRHVRHNPSAGATYKKVRPLRLLPWDSHISGTTLTHRVIYLHFDTGDGDLSILLDVLDETDEEFWTQDEVEDAARVFSALEKALRLANQIIDSLSAFGPGGGLG